MNHEDCNRELDAKEQRLEQAEKVIAAARRIGAETIYQRWNLEVEWFRRAMPTIGRLLEESKARELLAESAVVEK